MGYRSTFISVAEDCRATTGEVPPAKAAARTVAALQHAMLSGRPGHWTQEDVLLASSPAVRAREDVETLDELTEDERVALAAAYFAVPRACLRASPLPRTYGWGLHYDEDGRITLHAVGTPDYERVRADPALTQLRAMRSSRARG